MRRYVTVAAALLLGASTLVVAGPAQAATPCAPGPVTGCPREVSGLGYTIRQDPVANAGALHQALGASTYRDVSQVLDQANRPMSPLSSACRPDPAGLSASATFGFCWNSEDQGDDAFRWYPQGITTTADALGVREYDGVQAVAVTWYKRKSSDDETAVESRVSLAPAGGYNNGNNNYRHVLLVTPSGPNNFQQVPCHAGGAMWYGHLLYVACTNTIRVYDWNYLHQVKATSLPGEGFGRQSDGKYYANGNLYVMVQVATITNPSNNITFSSLSLDRLSSPDKLVVSGYHDTAGVNLWRFDLDYQTRMPARPYAYDAYDLPFAYVQGATTRADRFWFNSSTSSPKLRFWNRTSGNQPVVYTGEYGAESVSYWPSGDGDGGVPDYLFTLTERKGKREVFAVRQADFNG
ncbi:hypothetical protein ACNTMW_17455 [Planosporangium sp. 12N6]|uniref:hypothetical protein n=1 Tax=Planosporangium spinosum TaxID=3402278 RepID=UPI003CF39544